MIYEVETNKFGTAIKHDRNFTQLYIDNTSAEDDKFIRHLVKCSNAFDSAASRLGISVLDLAEALQDGGIAELVDSLAELRDWYLRNVGLPACRANAILAKIRKEGE